VITAPNSDLNVTDGQTDASPHGKNRATHYSDIIGITYILSQGYRYIVDFKKPTWTITTH